MDVPTLVVGGRQIGGWTRMSVTRGIERCTSGFELGYTELYPGQANDVIVQPGDAGQVMLGSDVVVTGYVDRMLPVVTKSSHEITLIGRGRCADLVDCSNEWPGCQISNGDPFQIATNLAAKYGIKVAIDPNAPRKRVPYLMFSRMESPWQIIEGACRWGALLAYELADGSLYLSQIGKQTHSSGAVYGTNIERAAFSASLDQRFSIYEAFLLGTDKYGDAGAGGNLVATQKDPGVPRHRMKAIVIEGAAAANTSLAAQRLSWECNRRIGRSQPLQVRVDSWRDSNNVLWQPNWLIPVNIPQLKVQATQLVIGKVTYNYVGEDEGGTTADLELMPPGAFAIEPPAIPPYQDVPAGLNASAR